MLTKNHTSRYEIKKNFFNNINESIDKRLVISGTSLVLHTVEAPQRQLCMEDRAQIIGGAHFVFLFFVLICSTFLFVQFMLPDMN